MEKQWMYNQVFRTLMEMPHWLASIHYHKGESMDRRAERLEISSVIEASEPEMTGSIGRAAEGCVRFGQTPMALRLSWLGPRTGRRTGTKRGFR